LKEQKLLFVLFLNCFTDGVVATDNELVRSTVRLPLL